MVVFGTGAACAQWKRCEVKTAIPEAVEWSSAAAAEDAQRKRCGAKSEALLPETMPYTWKTVLDLESALSAVPLPMASSPSPEQGMWPQLAAGPDCWATLLADSAVLQALWTTSPSSLPWCTATSTSPSASLYDPATSTSVDSDWAQCC